MRASRDDPDRAIGRSRVTDHAVVRWLERVRGLGPIIADNLPDSATDAARAAYGCWLLDLTPAEVREAILPRRLLPLVDLDPVAILAADRRLVISGGKVVTVLGKPKRSLRGP